jgi:hypothetical protein
MTGAGRVKPSASLEMASSLTLGTGALIGIERGARCMQALLDEAWAVGATFSVPSGVLAQAWRGTPRQARLARFLGLPNVAVVPLDDAGARAAGVLCGRSGVNDVVDASVVVCARLADDPVITSDPDDLRRLDPGLRIFSL